MNARKVFFIIPFCLWLFVSCRQKTDTAIINDLMTDMAFQIEKKDAAGLIANLAEDYKDFRSRDRQQTMTLVEAYFDRYRGIVIHVLASKIVFENTLKATVETDVALSSGAAQALRKLVRFSGENYRFKCRLHKNGRWLITEAQWEFIQMGNLFPESLKILQELFPNL